MYIIIVGCGKTGKYLAEILQADHNVVVIDKEKEAIDNLGEYFNGITILGDGMDIDVLKDAGIEKADALAVTTSNDNTNVLIAQIGKKIFNLTKVVARVSAPEKAELYRTLGVETVNSTAIFASLIRDKIIEEKFSAYILESSKLTTIEILTNSKLAGKKVNEINIPGEFRIITIVREQEPIIPDDDTEIQKNDTIVGLIKISSLKKLKRELDL
ncbi:MAG TPA: TrkA family potassium uptake protein [Candidatus Ratteibacteria bacterium]|nr:TrkA family potassium uptake protein [bacterium]HRR95947.1 TrkA family potassium uptake protein [Candidatus Ratteibacteria bacterium]